MTPESRRRLEAHAQAIVAAGGVPPVLREELVEELVGHLAARVEAATAAGTPEAEAVDRAIASFGSADRLGRDFQRTYHSRIWASTIGVLLPQVATGNPRPGAVGWLRFGVGLTIVVTSIAGVVALPSASPLRLLVGGPMLLASLVVGLLAFRALARGQRWALRYAMAVAVLLVAYGVRDVLFPAQPRTITFPIGAFVGVAILLVAQGSWVALQAFVNGSRPIGARLGLLVTATLVLPPLLFLPFADPTLASARDLEMHLSVTCGIGDVDIGDGQVIGGRERAEVVLDMTWRRTDLLPHGLSGIFGGYDTGDTVGLRLEPLFSGDGRSWTLNEPATLIDTATGAEAGWWGSSSPSVGLLPTDVAGSMTFGILQGELHAGRTLRATYHLFRDPIADAQPELYVQAYYAHLDRFVVEADAGCGERADGHQVRIPVPDPYGDQPFDPFAF